MSEKDDDKGFLTKVAAGLAGLVGSTAFIVGAGAYAGHRYETAYFRELGVAPSVLSFTTQEYAFHSGRVVQMLFGGVVAAAVGAAAGAFLITTIKESYESWKRNGKTWHIPNRVALGIIGLGVLAALILLVVAIRKWDLSPLPWEWVTQPLTRVLGQELGEGIGNALLAVFGASGILTAIWVSVPPINKAPASGVTAGIAAAFAAAGILVFAASYVARKDADYDRQRANWPRVSLVLNTSIGGEDEDRLGPEALEGIEGCVPIEGAKPSFCRIDNVLLPVKNNGLYFVIPESEVRDGTPHTHRVHAIPVELVVRVISDTRPAGSPPRRPCSGEELGTPTRVPTPPEDTERSHTCPVIYGSFRIVPAGWPAGVENSYSGSHSGELSRTSDERLLRQSDLYIELPASAELSETHDAVATRIGDDIVELRISYTSGIEIFRWRPALPLNMERTLEGGGRLFETGTVAGSPAVFYRSPPSDAPGDSIWFIKDGILTQISGGLPFDDLLAIAELVP